MNLGSDFQVWKGPKTQGYLVQETKTGNKIKMREEYFVTEIKNKIIKADLAK